MTDRVTRLYRALATTRPPRDRAALLAVLQAAIRAGAVPRDVGNWLKATLELPDLRLRNAMVPRVDVVAVAEDTSAADGARLMAERGRRRLPVYRGTLDHPRGVLHALDVAHSLAMKTREQAPPTAGQLARPALALADTLPLPEAIHAMHTQAAHLVLVIDEHGGLAGLATLEDIIEQLLGQLPDEYGDEGRDAIRSIGDGVVIVGAAAGLHEIERVLDVRFRGGRFVSIGGLVYERLGRVPRPGDVVELPGIRIEGLSMDGGRLRELRVHAGVGLSTSVWQPESAPGTGRRVELRIGKEVVCGTEVVGRLERLGVGPDSGRVSHLGIRCRRGVVVVPLEALAREDDGVLYLQPTACDALGTFPREERAFPGYDPGIISRNTEVVSADGPVGKVRQVLLDRPTGAATHIVVRIAGRLLRPREVVVPLSWARTITPERIELAVESDELDGLPEFRSDDEIVLDVLQRLDESPTFQGIDRYTARVDVDAAVVRLSGRVRTSVLKQAAEELAASVRGVLSVDNQLIADDELAIHVQAALRARSLQLEDLDVSVLLGQVRLRGRAVTAQDRRAAEVVAGAVPGVESVVDELEVQDVPANRAFNGS